MFSCPSPWGAVASTQVNPPSQAGTGTQTPSELAFFRRGLSSRRCSWMTALDVSGGKFTGLNLNTTGKGSTDVSQPPFFSLSLQVFFNMHEAKEILWNDFFSFFLLSSAFLTNPYQLITIIRTKASGWIPKKLDSVRRNAAPSASVQLPWTYESCHGL